MKNNIKKIRKKLVNLRPRMLVDKSKKIEEISSEEVANAIEIFKRGGGLIRKLSDQTIPLRDNMVYPDKSLARMGYISLTDAEVYAWE